MVKFIFLCYISLIPLTLCAQTANQNKENEWFGSNKRKTFLRAGLGFQWAAYSELGLSRMKMREGESLGLYAGSGYYAAFEWTPTYWPDKPYNIGGFKIGYETNLTVLSVAIETKYQTDFYNQDLVFTPKAGLNLVLMNIYYGYNISCFQRPFQYLGPHQLSIALYYNTKVWKEFWGNKRGR